MRSVKDEYRQMDFLFRHEHVQNQPVKDLIASSYEATKEINPASAQLAERRYRKGEHRIKTCLEMFISEPHYYNLLRVFLKTAKALYEKIFSAV